MPRGPGPGAGEVPGGGRGRGAAAVTGAPYTARVRGRLITFEGGEGCGKSTQLELTAARLEAMGRQVVRTREPGGTPLAEAARRIILDPALDPDPLAELFLLEAARRDHVRRVIGPALERGAVVLSDRFTDSSTVYQGLVGGLPAATVEGLNRLATGGLVPHLTVVLDLAPEEALPRVRRRNGAADSRQDARPMEFHRRVAESFRRLARRHPERIRVVDGSGPVEAVFERVWAVVEEVLA